MSIAARNKKIFPRRGPTATIHLSDPFYKKLEDIVKKFNDYAKQLQMATPAPAKASQIIIVKNSLKTASQFIFDPAGVFYRESRISSVLKTLTIHKVRNPRNPDNDDSEVMAMATKLYDRWISGDFTPDHPPNVARRVPRAVVANRGERRVRSWKATIRKNHKALGHNGIKIGEQWSCQEEAWWRGAHGHPIEGISSTKKTGAYSIVISGGSRYKNLDIDQGARILYSSFSAERSRVMGKSKYSRRPVRVLRAASGSSAFTPEQGIRYDGLYLVVNCFERRSNGEVYWLFELHKVQQPPRWLEQK